jgi:hypothetical protein
LKTKWKSLDLESLNNLKEMNIFIINSVISSSSRYFYMTMLNNKMAVAMAEADIEE